MKHAMKSLIAAACVLTACSANSTVPLSSEANIAPPSFDTAAMDTLLSGVIVSGEHVGLSALVYDEGAVVYQNAFGFADKDRSYAADMDTVWRIYSMTKPVTAALILDLQEEGLLSLDDPASKYIPELANMQVASADADGKAEFSSQTMPMTVKDLMLHRAGMGYGIFGEINPIETAYTKAGLFDPSESLSVKMQKLSKLPLLAQPGDGWYYSYSIDVLGRIAEVVTGRPLGELFQARIFGPLGMGETSFQVTAAQKARFATNYFLTNDGTYIVAEDSQTSPYLDDNAYQSGGGGLVSTLPDYAKFAQMLLDGGVYNGKRIISEASVKAMMSDQMDADDIFMMPWLGEATNASSGYGGSVQIRTTPEQVANTGKAKGQWGWGGAARTNFWIDPENDAFGIIMLQYFGQQDPKLHDSFRALAYAQTVDAPAKTAQE